MKLFGHPIHLMLIHFPSALFPMDFVCSVMGRYTQNESFIDASFYAICGGVILGWLAIVFGTFDLINVFEKHPEAMKKALVHGCLNSTVIIVYTVIAYVQFRHYPLLPANSNSLLLLKAGTIVLMIAGNYLGGSLILRYGVAVENK